MLEDDIEECVIIIHPYPNEFLPMVGGCFCRQIERITAYTDIDHKVVKFSPDVIQIKMAQNFYFHSSTEILNILFMYEYFCR